MKTKKIPPHKHTQKKTLNPNPNTAAANTHHTDTHTNPTRTHSSSMLTHTHTLSYPNPHTHNSTHPHHVNKTHTLHTHMLAMTGFGRAVVARKETGGGHSRGGRAKGKREEWTQGRQQGRGAMVRGTKTKDDPRHNSIATCSLTLLSISIYIDSQIHLIRK